MLYQHYKVVEKLLDGMVATSKKAKKKQEWEALITQLDDLSNQIRELEVQTMGKEKYLSLRECSHGKKQGGVQGDEALPLIPKKMKAQEEMSNEMKENIAMLNEASTSHSMTIQMQDAQIGHLISGHYPLFAEDLPNYNMGESKDEE
uniref:Uncharacterized protein n=1 Tax=Solanum tuberosum TaxID=4113 RepID=M1DIG0_SOLTU